MLLSIALVFGIAACSKREPVDKHANNTAGLPVINDLVPDASGAPPAKAPAGSAQQSAPAVRIPTALQGRWGLAPNDCTSTRGDAKGLLVIGPDQLTFYESQAVPGSGAHGDSDSISGNFRFTGEGHTWIRFEMLMLQGKELVRTESNPMASFTYARCK
jgi:hypothetical protein